MTVKNLLKLHQGGCLQSCVSIQQEPYNNERHRYKKTYFEEENQEDIIESDTFKSISNRKIDHFNIIGGGIYKTELCIYLKAKR